MNAQAVILQIVEKLVAVQSELSLELIRHEVELNWRERYTTAREQLDAIDESVLHAGPFSGDIVPVSGLEQTLDEAISRPAPASHALSVTSRVWTPDGDLAGHLALMNLHPEGIRSVEEVAAAVSVVTGGMPGYLLASGRHFHFYGCRLLTAQEWLDFVAEFLMPCTLVSPRYIGHCLHRRFSSLRLNAAPPHKPEVPYVVLALADDERLAGGSVVGR